MNDNDVTTGWYVGSKMYTEGLESTKTTIKNVFSGHALKHRIYLTNAVSNVRSSAGAWCDSEVDLMCVARKWSMVLVFSVLLLTVRIFRLTTE